MRALSLYDSKGSNGDPFLNRWLLFLFDVLKKPNAAREKNLLCQSAEQSQEKG